MTFRIPIFTLRALGARLLRLADRPATSSRETGSRDPGSRDPRGPGSSRRTSPGVELWRRALALGEDGVTVGDVHELRRQWLATPLIESLADLYGAALDGPHIPSAVLLRRFVSDSPGAPVGGGSHHRSCFDSRVEFATVTVEPAQQRPNASLRVGPLRETLDQIEDVFGPLQRVREDREDETLFVVGRLDAETRLDFCLSGGWRRLADRRFRHRTRFSADQETVPADQVFPESAHLRFLGRN